MTKGSALDVPIIDIAPLLCGDVEGTREVAAQVGAACRSIGFFYINGHGIPCRLMTDVYSLSRSFFEQPLAQKEALSITRSMDNRGYAGVDTEALNSLEAVDAKEAFNIGRGATGWELGPWPDAVAGFHAVMTVYERKMRVLCERLHAAFAIDLGLPPEYFSSLINRPMAVLRLLHYPPIERMSDGRVGAGTHTDYGNMTILAQDSVGGLEVRLRSGEWIAAPPVAGTFVCNIGDCLMRWSNDVYVSTPHRVVGPTGQDRYSVAYFFDPNPEALVECLPGCEAPERPARYAPILAGDYLKSRLDATYSFRRSASVTP